MTLSEIKSKIVEWITTGIPSNVKSFRLRTLLTNLSNRIDVLEPGRLKITKAVGNSALDLEIGDTVYGYIENQLVREGIYFGGDQSLLSSYFIVDGNGQGGSGAYHEYDNITALIADQSNQNAGDICLVEDATDDPDIDSGDATYIYLGLTNGDLNDYRRLTDSDLVQLQSNYKTFGVKAISDVDINDTPNGTVSIKHTNSSIDYFVFDALYSSGVVKIYNQQAGAENLRLKIYNKTLNSTYLLKCTSIVESTTSGYYKAFVESNSEASNVQVNNTIEVDFDIDEVGASSGGSTSDQIYMNVGFSKLYRDGNKVTTWNAIDLGIVDFITALGIGERELFQAPFDCVLKSVAVFEGNINGGLQNYAIDLCIGSRKRTTTNTTSVPTNPTEEQILFQKDGIPTISAGVFFSGIYDQDADGFAVSGSDRITIPKGHHLVPLIRFKRTGTGSTVTTLRVQITLEKI